MTKQNLTILGGGVVIVLLMVLGGGLVTWKLFFSSPYNTVTTSGETEIGPHWREIHPSEPLSVEKEEQYVSLGVVPPYRAWACKGITLPTGQLVMPEIKLIAADGQEYDLTYHGSRRGGSPFSDIEYADFEYTNGLPRSIKIEKILLRSDAPLRVTKIVWLGYNWDEAR